VAPSYSTFIIICALSIFQLISVTRRWCMPFFFFDSIHLLFLLYCCAYFSWRMPSYCIDDLYAQSSWESSKTIPLPTSEPPQGPHHLLFDLLYILNGANTPIFSIAWQCKWFLFCEIRGQRFFAKIKKTFERKVIAEIIMKPVYW